MNRADWEKRQSLLIDAMRFPLIVFVLITHTISLEVKPFDIVLTSMGVYKFLSEIISHNFVRIVVPSFFLFSGFLFFHKMTKWTTGFYKSQLKKRIRTLLIPYFLWNALMVAAILLKVSFFDILKFQNTDELNGLKAASFFDIFWNFPLNFPLWYVRDLICMTILTPVFYYLFYYTKLFGLLVLVVMYLLVIESGLPGLSTTAFLFFGAGAYFGIFKKNILLFCNNLKTVSLTGSIVLLLLATYFNGIQPQYEYLIRLFVLLGVITAINLTNTLINNQKIRNFFIKLSPAVFFVYAIHGIYINGWMRGLFFRPSLSNNGLWMIMSYILIPFFTLVICLAIYNFWKRVSPRSLAVFTGGRISEKPIIEKSKTL